VISRLPGGESTWNLNAGVLIARGVVACI
jgi:hypothetical protein